MQTQPVSDQPTVYHAGLCPAGAESVSEDDLDFLCGYVVLEVTAANAERHGYRPDEAGLKVRCNKVHLADVTDLAAAVRAITADLARRVCLVAGPRPDGAFYEAMLRVPQPA